MNPWPETIDYSRADAPLRNGPKTRTGAIKIQEGF